MNTLPRKQVTEFKSKLSQNTVLRLQKVTLCHGSKCAFMKLLTPSNTGKILVQLVAQHCCIAS